MRMGRGERDRSKREGIIFRLGEDGHREREGQEEREGHRKRASEGKKVGGSVSKELKHSQREKTNRQKRKRSRVDARAREVFHLF